MNKTFFQIVHPNIVPRILNIFWIHTQLRYMYMDKFAIQVNYIGQTIAAVG